MIKKKFIFAIVMLSLLSEVTFGATLVITGTVQPPIYNCAISLDVSQYDVATDISQSPVVDALAATVTETCDNPTGYTVTVSSLNNALLKNASTNETTAYSVKYNDVAVSGLGTTPVTVTDANASGSGSRSVKVSIPQNSALNAGTYSDTLTFTVAAK